MKKLMCLILALTWVGVMPTSAYAGKTGRSETPEKGIKDSPRRTRDKQTCTRVCDEEGKNCREVCK